MESLADQFDYTLLMECSENYVCQVKKMAVVDHLVRFAKKSEKHGKLFPRLKVVEKIAKCFD